MQLVDLGFISQVELHQKSFKKGIHSFPAWCSACRDSAENKPASLLVVSLVKTLNEVPSSSCRRKIVGPSSLPVVGPTVTEDLQIDHKRSRSICTSSCIMLRTNSSNDDDEKI